MSAATSSHFEPILRPSPLAHDHEDSHCGGHGVPCRVESSMRLGAIGRTRYVFVPCASARSSEAVAMWDFKGHAITPKLGMHTKPIRSKSRHYVRSSIELRMLLPARCASILRRPWLNSTMCVVRNTRAPRDCARRTHISRSWAGLHIRVLV